jgi:predicted transcriptional regulator
MTATTSLKLPDELKSAIARVAATEGKSAHALMVETLQSAMNDALLRQQFQAEAMASYEQTLRTGEVYAEDEVRAYIKARAIGNKLARPKPRPLNMQVRLAGP